MPSAKKKIIKEEKFTTRVEKGSHLTVTHFENGSVHMQWDDEALARDIRNAIKLAEDAIQFAENGKAKTTKQKKSSATR